MTPHGTSLIVLIAEDEMMVGMALEDALTEAGYTVAGVFGTSSGALKWLDSHPVDAAVVDFILRDGYCAELLRELKSRGVPVLLYSGIIDIPAEFEGLPLVIKAATPLGEVVNAVNTLLLGEVSDGPQGRGSRASSNLHR